MFKLKDDTKRLKKMARRLKGKKRKRKNGKKLKVIIKRGGGQKTYKKYKDFNPDLIAF